jgi:hypothetical protein
MVRLEELRKLKEKINYPIGIRTRYLLACIALQLCTLPRDGLLFGKDLEGRRHCVIEALSRHLPGGTGEKYEGQSC